MARSARPLTIGPRFPHGRGGVPGGPGSLGGATDAAAPMCRSTPEPSRSSRRR
jgi:hypothetical protein